MPLYRIGDRELGSLGGKMRMKTSTILFSVANLMGLLLCAFFVSGIVKWARMEERDYHDASDGIAFFATVGPVLFVCFLLNTIWGVKALVDIFRRRDYQASLALGAVASVWIASFLMMRFVL
jgi:TRAP-type C4-dicarboxylate transport system permease small subunit